MKKRIISALLGGCMMAALLPVSALAVDEPPTQQKAQEVIVAGVTLTDGMGWNNNGTTTANGSQNNNVYFKDGTLYLNDAEIEGARQGVTVSDGSITVDVSGENVISVYDEEWQYSALEFAYQDPDAGTGTGDIVIQGDGSLEIYSNYTGINVCPGKTLTIRDTMVYVVSDWYGIIANGRCDIAGANVSVISNHVALDAGDMVIADSWIVAYGQAGGISSGSLHIDNSAVAVQASYRGAILCSGTLSIAESIVEAYNMYEGDDHTESAIVVSDKESGTVNINGMYVEAGVSALDAKAVTDFDTTFGEYSYALIAPSKEEAAWENPFTDVQEDAWYYEHVAYVNEYGLMAGIDVDKFNPLGKVSRAQAVQMMYNISGNYPRQYGLFVSESAEFTDVAENQWYAEAVGWGGAAGVVSGMGNNQFAPNANVTREQFAVILRNYADKLRFDTSASGDVSRFKDAGTISDWAKGAMQWAVGAKVMSGTDDGSLNPQGTLTRAEAASMLRNFINATLAQAA